MAAGTMIAAKAHLIGSIVGFVGGAVYLCGDYAASNINKFKNLCKFEITTYFKWKTKKKYDYRYYMKSKSYVKYYKKGKKTEKYQKKDGTQIKGKQKHIKN